MRRWHRACYDDGAGAIRPILDQPIAMKVALTSQNFKTVTGHAGKARRFLIYDLRTPCSPREIERRELPMELAFSRFAGGPHPLDDVDVIITGGAGAGFTNRLAKRGIEVVICSETDPGRAVRDYAHRTVKTLPPNKNADCD